MRTIKNGWEDYKKHCVPKSASHTQIDETKKAFYGGCLVMFHLMMDSADEGDIEEGEKAVSKLHDEVIAFAKEMTK